mmetsp:Transcript_18007/g.58800  ORF Transcript_18007/g.58800 Transcript_18007/m.58800 type:complete len:255 (+) Transcript_18007:791-1555(+)
MTHDGGEGERPRARSRLGASPRGRGSVAFAAPLPLPAPPPRASCSSIEGSTRSRWSHASAFHSSAVRVSSAVAHPPRSACALRAAPATSDAQRRGAGGFPRGRDRCVFHARAPILLKSTRSGRISMRASMCAFVARRNASTRAPGPYSRSRARSARNSIRRSPTAVEPPSASASAAAAADASLSRARGNRPRRASVRRTQTLAPAVSSDGETDLRVIAANARVKLSSQLSSVHGFRSFSTKPYLLRVSAGGRSP